MSDPQSGPLNPLDLDPGHPYGPDNLPYGVYTTEGDPDLPRIGVRYGSSVLDAGAAADAFGSRHTALLQRPTLNPLMAAGRAVWDAVRAELQAWLTSDNAERRAALVQFLLPLDSVTLRLPFEPADYVDFYSSEHHAARVSRILRPGAEPLPPQWKHLPVGYHGRAGTVVVSGTPVVRPCGQRRSADGPAFGPSQRLDFEAEVGFVVGVPSPQGSPVPLERFRDHVFGVTLLNDWSARDLQAWEYVPLGPFLGKSFATSVSPWITPLAALDAAWTAPPPRDFPLLPYLDDGGAGGKSALDLRISVALNGYPLAEPPFAAMYWTPAQQLAHLTVNGASLRTGDLYGSGTVSGPGDGQRGCLLELTWGGRDPLRLPFGARDFLADSDEVTLTAWAPAPGGGRIGLGAVHGRVHPAREPQG